ncbi:MAG: hypothetical protein ACE5J7_00365 [Candidatus Aenigmatarchaeota archaeon]
MGYLENKRKMIESGELIPFESKEAAVEALQEQRYCSDAEIKVKEREISREQLEEDGATKRYLVTKVVEEYDPDEANRQFYIKAVQDGSIELYRNREGTLVVIMPDKVLEKWDKEREANSVRFLYTPDN